MQTLLLFELQRIFTPARKKRDFAWLLISSLCLYIKKPVLKKSRFLCKFIDINYSVSLYRIGIAFFDIDWGEGNVILPVNLHLIIS